MRLFFCLVAGTFKNPRGQLQLHAWVAAITRAGNSYYTVRFLFLHRQNPVPIRRGIFCYLEVY